MLYFPLIIKNVYLSKQPVNIKREECRGKCKLLVLCIQLRHLLRSCHPVYRQCTSSSPETAQSTPSYIPTYVPSSLPWHDPKLLLSLRHAKVYASFYFTLHQRPHLFLIAPTSPSVSYLHCPSKHMSTTISSCSCLLPHSSNTELSWSGPQGPRSASAPG